MGEGPNRSGNSRRWITTAVEASLTRLQTDWIDLYQVRRPDPRRTSRRPCRSSPTLCTRARSARSAARPSPPSRSCRRTGPPNGTQRTHAVQDGAAAVLAPRPRHRAVRPSGLPDLPDGGPDLEPARLGLPVRQVPQGPAGRPDHGPRRAGARTLRPGPAGERGQPRGRRGPGGAGRGPRLQPAPARRRVPADTPSRDVGRDRASHHGAAAEPARRRHDDARRVHSRPHRRDCSPRHQRL